MIDTVNSLGPTESRGMPVRFSDRRISLAFLLADRFLPNKITVVVHFFQVRQILNFVCFKAPRIVWFENYKLATVPNVVLLKVTIDYFERKSSVNMLNNVMIFLSLFVSSFIKHWNIIWIEFYKNIFFEKANFPRLSNILSIL